MLEQKYPKSLIEARTSRAKEITLEILRQPKTAKNGKLSFHYYIQSKQSKRFPITNQSFDNFQHSKTMPNIVESIASAAFTF